MTTRFLALFLIACGTETSVTSDTPSAAVTEAVSQAPVFGTYVEVTGTVRGEHLILNQGLKTEQGPVAKLELVGGPFQDGTTLTLSGRLDPVVQDIIGLARLSGISNLSEGEPKFDGQHFFNRDGEQLEVLHYTRPLIYDAPAQVFVRDVTFNTVHVGSMGGFIPPHMNPFHGFHTVANINAVEDQGVVAFNDEGEAINAATGNVMTEVGNIPSPGGDQFSYVWFYDGEARTLFGLRSGGFIGLKNDVFEVVQL